MRCAASTRPPIISFFPALVGCASRRNAWKSFAAIPDFVSAVEMVTSAWSSSIPLRVVAIDAEQYAARLWSFREYGGATVLEENERAIELWQELHAARAREQRLLALLERARGVLACERECCASAVPSADAGVWLEAHLNALECAGAATDAPALPL